MKSVEGRITILVSDSGACIEIRDVDAVNLLCNVNLSAEDFCSALGRLSYIPCSVEIGDLNKIGKKRLTRKLVFEIDRPNKSVKVKEGLKRLI